MPKKITLDVLTTQLTEDLDWRKKEISDLLFLANPRNANIIAKSSVLMIYSHWEGYIKNACKNYLRFISDSKITLNHLSFNFEAISLKGKIKSIIESSSGLTLTNELSLINSIYSNGEENFSIPSKIKNEKNKEFINTQDNLNLKILNSLLEIIGLEKYESLDLRENYIGEMLLNQRNAISHGTRVDGSDGDFNLDIEHIKKMRNFIFTIMETIQDEILHHAENELYLHKNESQKKIKKDEFNISLAESVRNILDS